MPKVFLKYTLPEEQEEFSFAIQATSLHHAVCKFDGKLRDIVKHESDKYSKDFVSGIDTARDILRVVLSEYELSL
jgi:hypothetical protein